MWDVSVGAVQGTGIAEARRPDQIAAGQRPVAASDRPRPGVVLARLPGAVLRRVDRHVSLSRLGRGGQRTALYGCALSARLSSAGADNRVLT